MKAVLGYCVVLLAALALIGLGIYSIVSPSKAFSYLFGSFMVLFGLNTFWCLGAILWKSSSRSDTDAIESRMKVPSFTNCPRCGKEMADGFAVRGSGIFFTAPEKFKKFAFVNENIEGLIFSRTGFGVVRPAEYYDSYACRSCELYIIDYSTALEQKVVVKIAKSRGLI